MTRRSTPRLALAGLAVLAAAACADSNRSSLTPNTPTLAANNTATLEKAVSRQLPIGGSFTRSVDVDTRGGELRIDEVGLKLTIPSQAIRPQDGTVHITVTVLAGGQLAYDFQPVGLTFQKPLRFEQDLRDIVDLSQVSSTMVPHLSYFKSLQDIDPVSGIVRTYEDIASNLDLSGHTLKADIWHFSGYIVSWGRQ